MDGCRPWFLDIGAFVLIFFIVFLQDCLDRQFRGRMWTVRLELKQEMTGVPYDGTGTVGVGVMIVNAIDAAGINRAIATWILIMLLIFV